MDAGPGGFRNDRDWDTAANGGYDEHWNIMAAKLDSMWSKFACVHLAMFHECNGTWYPWSINDSAKFRAAWKRYANIFRTKLSQRNLKIVLTLNSENNCGIPIDDYLPDAADFDLLGVDLYDFPRLDTQEKWDVNTKEWRGNGPYGFQAWVEYAKKINKPICFPEWGVSPDRERTPFDNPFYIEKMHESFKSIAPVDPNKPGVGQLAGEAYFNEYPTHCQLYPDTPVPNAAEKYKSLSWGE